MKKILIILVIFGLDRLTKMYLINLQATGTEIDFYIFPFLNFYLVWNTGIGFGLASLESNVFYHSLTAIIAIINLILVVILSVVVMVFVICNGARSFELVILHGRVRGCSWSCSWSFVVARYRAWKFVVVFADVRGLSWLVCTA